MALLGAKVDEVSLAVWSYGRSTSQLPEDKMNSMDTERSFMVQYVQLTFTIILIETKMASMDLKLLFKLSFKSWNGELMSNSAFWEFFLGETILTDTDCI